MSYPLLRAVKHWIETPDGTPACDGVTVDADAVSVGIPLSWFFTYPWLLACNEDGTVTIQAHNATPTYMVLGIRATEGSVLYAEGVLCTSRCGPGVSFRPDVFEAFEALARARSFDTPTVALVDDTVVAAHAASGQPIEPGSTYGA